MGSQGLGQAAGILSASLARAPVSTLFGIHAGGLLDGRVWRLPCSARFVRLRLRGKFGLTCKLFLS